MGTNLPFLIEEDGQAIVLHAGRYLMTAFAASEHDLSRATINEWAREWEASGEQWNGWLKVIRLGRSGTGTPWWIWEPALLHRKETGYHPKHKARVKNPNKGHRRKIAPPVNTDNIIKI